jgi:predicted MPP superfamily phosphohydrolase
MTVATSPAALQKGPRISRRLLLQAGLGGAAALALYASEVERHWIETAQTEIRLGGLPEAFHGLRVAQLSDIHMDEFTEPFFVREAVNRINKLQPDLVLLTGDFVSDMPMGVAFATGAAWQCANLLTGLNCRHRYAVLGNHDVAVGSQPIIEALAANGIQLLHNAHTAFERDGARLWLAGLDDPLLGRPDPDRAIPTAIRNVGGEPVVLLCHAPDYADSLRTDSVGGAIDFMLSGHTHGGQVRLPLVGAMQLPQLGRKYVHGHFRFGKMQLYVNRGLGTVGVPFRFDCPPEITLHTLLRA